MTPPTTIGPYRVVRSLGQGGMGEVSLAYDDRLRRHVALKSVLERSDGRDTASALINEARAAAALSHPGIASIFDIIEEQDRAYIVMEFVEGETLAARLRGGPLAGPAAMNVATQLCAALDAAHTQRVIHRDLKPGNIMIGPDGRAKILDFGLAKHATVAAPSAPTTELSSASIGSGMGTVGYMAPEQILGEAVDRRCDIFSLGAVLFEMFTGRRPFIERDAVAYGVRVTTTDAPSATAINASVSSDISAVIARALARRPSDRFESASALADALQTAATLPHTVTLDTTRSTRLRRPAMRVAISAIALVAAIVGALALLAYPRSSAVRGTSDHPAVLAIIPATALDVDPTLQAVAAGVTAVVSANLGGVGGLNVVTGGPATPSTGSTGDSQQVMQRAGAGSVLEITLRPASGAIAARAAIRRSGEQSPIWQNEFEGDALTITRRLLLGLAGGIVDANLVSNLSGDERRHLLTMPTDNTSAFIDYAHGRQLLNGVVTAEVINQSARHFDRAGEQDPKFALAFAGLAESLRRRYQQQNKDPNDIARAIDAASRAVALDGDQAAVLLTLSSVLSATGRTADALAAVDRAIELQPASDNAYRVRGSLLVQAGRRDEGIAALQHAVDLRPSYYANHESLGFSLYRMGRLQEAANAYRRVTELAPDFSNGYLMLGTSLHAMGHPEEAVGHYEHAVRLGPTSMAYSNLAYSYYETGRYGDALTAFQEAIKREPRRPGLHRNIGDVYARLGRKAEARAAYESAVAAGEALLKVNANDANTIALVALSEAKLGRTLAAERHAAEALAIAPKNMEVAVRNAEVYAILRQPRRALSALQTALSLGYDAATAAKNEELQSLKGTQQFTKLVATIPTK